VTGWAEANACGGIGRPAAWTGRDPSMTLSGTDVAPARFAKLLMVTLLLITVKSLTWPVLTWRR
jgi:hypothetical protein